MQMLLLPLVTHAWRPQDAKPELNLKAGATAKWVIRYKRRDDGRGAATANPMPSHEPLLRLPFLVTGADIVTSGNGAGRIAAGSAALAGGDPVQSGDGVLCQPICWSTPAGAALEAKWEATWMGASRSGEIKLGAGEQSELPIRFPLPEQGTIPFYKQSALSVLITIGSQVLRFDRKVDLSRNFGLKEAVPMLPTTAKESPKIHSWEIGLSRSRSRRTPIATIFF
jgi:hypothetical protein